MRTLRTALFSCWTALIVFGCAQHHQPAQASQAPISPAVAADKATAVAHSGDVYWQFNPAQSNTAAQHAVSH